MTLRVLHVIESARPEAGSVAVVMPGLFQALRRLGIESELAAGEPAEAMISACDGACVDSRALGGTVARVDMTHVHGWGYPLAEAAARAARSTGRPYVVSPHGALASDPHHPRSLRESIWAWWRGDRLVRNASAVTALHEIEEHALRAKRLNENIVRLPLGIDAKEYDTTAQVSPATPSESDGRCILLMGPIHPAEGFVPLLKAMAELGPEADGWKVVLAGKEVGDWRRQLEAAVRRKGGEGRVQFAPAPDHAAQRAWLARASIVASPCLRIRPPVSVLQAAATGVVALASTAVAPDGLGEGVQVCAPTRGDIKLGLRRLLGMTDDQRTAMARRSRGAVLERVDWTALTPLYARLYEDLV